MTDQHAKACNSEDWRFVLWMFQRRLLSFSEDQIPARPGGETRSSSRNDSAERRANAGRGMTGGLGGFGVHACGVLDSIHLLQLHACGYPNHL